MHAGRGRVLEGLHFLVTGFADKLEDKRVVLELIKEQGGVLVDRVPPPAQPEQQQQVGGRRGAL